MWVWERLSLRQKSIQPGTKRRHTPANSAALTKAEIRPYTGALVLTHQ